MGRPDRRPDRRRRAPGSRRADGALEVRRAGPAELFAEVAPLLAHGAAGEEALARLAELLQHDPALIDLRLAPDAVVAAVRSGAPEGLDRLPSEARDALLRHALPPLVSARLGRDAAAALAAAAARHPEGLDRSALSLGRYFAILDDVEGAAGAAKNPLWHLLFELTFAEAAGATETRRELLRLPAPVALVRASATTPERLEPSLASAVRLALDAIFDEAGEPAPAADEALTGFLSPPGGRRVAPAR